MKKLYLFTYLILFSTGCLFSQNGIIGEGFGTNNWSTTDNFFSSAGDSRIGTFNANGTGNQYFRTVINWDGNYDQFTITIGSDVAVSADTEYNPNQGPTTSGAMYLNVSSTSHNYVFKTRNGGTSPSHNLIIFQVQGDIRSVSTVTRDKATVYRGQDAVITATLNGSLSTGQGVYLRYSIDNFTNSTVIEMTGSGTSYTANIPAGTNTSGANVVYYVFTSGDGLTISGANVDWYTINLNNNTGTNYSYTVNSAYITAQAGDWGTAATWADGVPGSGASVIIDHNVTLDVAATLNSLTINTDKELNGGSATLTISSGGTFTNNGTYTASTGTVDFSGSGTVSGSTATSFYNLGMAGGVVIGGNNTVNNRLVINTGGYLSQTAGGPGIVNQSDIPNYGSDATLVFTGAFDINSIASGWGTAANKFPANFAVEGTGVATLSMARSISGKVDIAIGATLNANGNLTIQSDATATASLLNLGTLNGNITVERYIPGVVEEWHLVSSPVSVQVISGATNWQPGGTYPDGSGYDFYAWHEEGKNWVNRKNTTASPVGDGPTFDDAAVNGDLNFNPPRGYMTAFQEANPTKSFTGEPINTNQPYTMSRTGTGDYVGLNLVGNPFPATIAGNSNADATNNFIGANTSVLDDAHVAYYYWDNSRNPKDYTAVNQASGAHFIEVGQGVFVVAKADDDILNFNTNLRKHGSATFYKNAEVRNGLIISANAADGKSNTTEIVLSDGMTKGLDPGYDAAKLPGNNEISLYSFLVEPNEHKFAIQALPTPDDGMVIKLGLLAGEAGVYQFTFEPSEQFTLNNPAFIMDLKTGSYEKIEASTTFSFNVSEPGEINDRFEIHFGALSLGESSTQSAANAYVHGNTLYILNAKGQTQAELYDLQGRMLQSQRFMANGLHSQNIALPAGVYVVRVMDDAGVRTAKVVVR